MFKVCSYRDVARMGEEQAKKALDRLQKIESDFMPVFTGKFIQSSVHTACTNNHSFAIYADSVSA